MLGKTHAVLGVMTAVSALTLMPDLTSSISMTAVSCCLASAASLLTSQLPDIDVSTSHASKAVPITKMITSPKAGLVYFILALVFTFASYFVDISSKTYIKWCVPLAIAFYALLAINVFGEKIFGHRKITHTLLFAAFVIILCYIPYYKYFQGNYVYINLLIGVSAGILSHLFYDCLTKKGCPLFAPCPVKNVHFLNLKSGKHDYIGCIISIAILALCIWARTRGHILSLSFF